MHCPVCQFRNSTEFTSVAGIKYFECDDCGSIFADPDFISKVDAGTLENYGGDYWKFEVASSRQRSFGSSVVRVAEVFLYSRIEVRKFVDIGSGPGFLLDALSALLPSSEDVFHAVELFPPPAEFRTRHKNYTVSALGDLTQKFQAGCCVEVIEHLTPTMLDGLVAQMASKSDQGAIYYFGSGQPDYVKKEDPGYLDPLVRGHIVSYSITGLSRLFAKHGFNVIPLPGRAWAFLAEFGPPANYTEDELLTRLWTALPENIAVLKDPRFGPLMYSMGLESARCYLEASLSQSRANWALSLQEQLTNPVAIDSPQTDLITPTAAATNVDETAPVHPDSYRSDVFPASFYPFPSRRAEKPADVIKGTCTVCGNASAFTGFTSNLRESGICSHCGSFNRQRQMAHVARQAYKLPSTGPLRLPEEIYIFNTETTGAVHHALKGAKNYYSSEYFGEEFISGDTVQGRKHEDLQRLSLQDDSVDLVLSSDVLEHMPAPYTAHKEIFRVLKPGGRHIFTVPFDSSSVKDDVRAELIDGAIHYLAPALFHGDPVRPDEGVLVWTIFGLEMLVKLADLGFRVFAWNTYSPSLGILGETPVVFEARKPLAE